jgi:hypothetical protein
VGDSSVNDGFLDFDLGGLDDERAIFLEVFLLKGDAKRGVGG